MADDVRFLLTAGAVRRAADAMLDLALAGDLPDWRVDLDRLPHTAQVVAEVIRAQYPTLEVPFHARWRHFTANGRDLWAELDARTAWPDAAVRARAAFDLVIVSVLLDAGAGPDWRYHDTETGQTLARSEGLGVASLRLFQSGVLSASAEDPLRADALERFDATILATAFQVSNGNPLLGLEGRAALIRRLGAAVGRPGDLYDAMLARAEDDQLPAPAILEVLLERLGPIWENRLVLDGAPLGDTWKHPSLGLVPIHKLSQWLAYSLIEPLQAAGVEVTDIDGLTGLAEYRNGGLFLDDGVMILKDPADLDRVHAVSDPLVVAWRSLTVALLDRIAPLVRERLGVSEADFPMAKVLEGGTWAAGRRLARERRSDGGPPLKITSDGTVF
ncbi:DUF1688 family protein [Caulobacter mirabilis]|uniref:Uracil phosphoribosyltransferase n=1 Tax=Caulobacter mirabilis TaxID=69666 RepID=A0A2D2AV31_9CAUL|nr:DUF1688 family protein [Caulobacter mirabilis]ATQ41882.1 uracil phosphoribosyltransferase [Caulobacter mirabilis]